MSNLNSLIIEESINIKQLKEEVESALDDTSFNWVEFAFKNDFIWDVNSLSKKNVIDHMRYYLWELYILKAH